MNNERSGTNELYSDDVFQVLFDYEVSRSKRYPTPLSLLFIKMYPTASQDSALETAASFFATELNTRIRAADIPSATGNLFKILLPATNEAGARTVCDRLLSIFKNKFNTPDGNAISYSMNIGCVSHAGGETLSKENLLEKAKSALQLSQQKGVNTYTVLV
ncbi:MAG: hypothetical protein U0Z26_14515 [Anaerolineales bacterium]